MRTEKLSKPAVLSPKITLTMHPVPRASEKFAV
jgi:hypothetical protein